MKYIITFTLIIFSVNSFSQNLNYDLLIKAGLDNYTNNLNQEALVNFEKAHSLDSTRVEAYYYTGVVLANTCHESGSLCKEAITMLSTAININPNFRKSLYNRGVCFLRLNMFKEAITDFDNAIKLDKKNTDAYANRGIAKIKFGKKIEGCNDIQEAINLNSSEAQKLKALYCE